MFIRLAPSITIAVLALPVLCGLAGTALPAFGYFPHLGGDHFSLAPFSALFAQPGIVRSAVQAMLIGLVTSAISVFIVALFTASWYGTRFFKRAQHFLSPLLAVPHVAAAFGFAFMIAPSGFISRLISPTLTGWERPPDLLIVNDPAGLALMAGLVIKEVPFLLLVTLAALPQVPAQRALRLSQSLGYGRVSGFLLTVWPGIYAQIRLAVFAVIAYASANVDVAAILGPTVPQTLPVRLAGWMNDPDLSMRFMACAGAILQIGVTLGALAIWIALERVGRLMCIVLGERGIRMRKDRSIRLASAIVIAGQTFLIFGGLALLAVWSVSGLWQFPAIAPDGLTLRMWQQTLPRLNDPLITTTIIALASTIISVVLVIGCLMRENQVGKTGGHRALFLVYLPLIVPQIGFLFGLQMLLITLDADASWPAMILAHIVFVLPYVFLSLSAPWRAYDLRFEIIAAALGKSANEIFWRIRLPMLLRAVLAASAVGFAVSVGQYLPTLLIGAGRFSTITTEAVALGSGGNRRIIGVYAFLQMLLPFLGFALAGLIPALLFRKRRAITGL